MTSAPNMKSIFFLVLLLCGLTFGTGHDYWQTYETLVNNFNTNSTLKQLWVEHQKQFQLAFEHAHVSYDKFPCEPSRSSSRPTSVNKLLPGDIKVIGAIGDSITAGNGILAINPLDVLFQDRGHSFSIGGYKNFEEGVVTLPNMLRMYRNDLYGYSTDGGDVDSEYAKFNLAEPGNTCPDLPEQVNRLADRMQKDKDVNYDLDWKLITIFIGGNDLCWVCNDEEGLNPSAFLTNMRKTLDLLSQQMRRTLVNVIPIMDITPLRQIADGLICDAIQSVICPCGSDEELTSQIQEYQQQYSKLTENLIKSGVYEREDFTIVFQPFLRDAKPPTKADGKADVSYFAPDCFHFSELGHKALARNLFNSLFQRVPGKQTSITFKEQIQCPSKGQYIQTNKNAVVSTSPPYTENEVEKQQLRSPETSQTAPFAAGKPSSHSGQQIGLLTVAGFVGGVCLILIGFGAGMLINMIRVKKTNITVNPI